MEQAEKELTLDVLALKLKITVAQLGDIRNTSNQLAIMNLASIEGIFITQFKENSVKFKN